MKYKYLIYILLSLLIGVSNFLVIQSIIFSIVLLLIFLLYFFLYLDRKRTYYKRNLSRSYEAINYINNFIISLSINPSITTAFENAKNSSSPELKKQIDAITHLSHEEQIEYLYKYFEIPIYGVFINVIKQFIFNGGDILEISQVLIRDSRALEDRLLDFERMSLRKMKEFASSWLLTLVILFILQFSLNSIYTTIDQLSYYPLLIFIFFLIFLLNFYLMTEKIYDITFMTKGDSNVIKETKTKNPKTKSKSKKRAIKIFNR